ncbi:MAG: hypothetical protein J6U54_15405 [Clostridiales bacterium]|nr:hypothetical protein [Clostridiales bacterium]
MAETITLDKKVLMDLLSTTAQQTACYLIGMCPGVTSEGVKWDIQAALCRGGLFNVHIDADVREHIITIVERYRCNNDIEALAGALVNETRLLIDPSSADSLAHLCSIESILEKFQNEIKEYRNAMEAMMP